MSSIVLYTKEEVVFENDNGFSPVSLPAGALVRVDESAWLAGPERVNVVPVGLPTMRARVASASLSY